MWHLVEIILEIYYSLCQGILHGMEMLYFLWMCHLDTSILTSFKMNRDNTFIINLIRKGYNMKSANKLGETPLHLAVSRSSRIEIVHELIKSGADINAQDIGKRTPLRHAIQDDNVEAVCILLYYDADVNIVCKQGMTPFTYALYSFRLNIARVLMDFYDDFSNQKCYRVTSLHLAVAHDSGVAMRLLTKGADVNSVTHCGQSLLEFSLHYNKGNLFKYILSKMDHKVLLQRSGSFLLQYVNQCYFATPDWLEGIHLLLESPVAPELAELCNDWMGYDEINTLTFFKRLAQVFSTRKIAFKERLSIIYICLSLGVQANIYDLMAMYVSYGFNEEVEALLDVTVLTNSNREPFPLSEDYYVNMPAFILAIELDLGAKAIYNMLGDQMKSSLDVSLMVLAAKSCADFLGFFSMSAETRKQIMDLNLPHIYFHQLMEIFDVMQSRTPEVPTLIELSRKPAREFIKQAYQVKRPCQFHDAVRDLNVPLVIKDIIRFKTPIY